MQFIKLINNRYTIQLFFLISYILAEEYKFKTLNFEIKLYKVPFDSKLKKHVMTDSLKPGVLIILNILNIDRALIGGWYDHNMDMVIHQSGEIVPAEDHTLPDVALYVDSKTNYNHYIVYNYNSVEKRKCYKIILRQSKKDVQWFSAVNLQAKMIFKKEKSGDSVEEQCEMCDKIAREQCSQEDCEMCDEIAREQCSQEDCELCNKFKTIFSTLKKYDKIDPKLKFKLLCKFKKSLQKKNNQLYTEHDYFKNNQDHNLFKISNSSSSDLDIEFNGSYKFFTKDDVKKILARNNKNNETDDSTNDSFKNELTQRLYLNR